MRVLVSQFSHESNCFAAGITGRDKFEALELMTGAEVVEHHRERTSVVSGFIHVLEKAGHTVEGAVAAVAFPSGPVDGGFYGWVKDTLLAGVRAGSWDGILLSLHGAMFVERSAGVPDPEGDLVAAVRATVGPDMPIGLVLDLHSDTTDLLLASADYSLAYNEEPHRDGYERGREAADLLIRMWNGMRPVMVRERVPMILPAINMATDRGPMHELHNLRAELETRPGILDVSIHGGFYGSDQREAGFSVLCTTDGDAILAQATAREMASAAWARRDEFFVDLTSPEDAANAALTAGEPIGLVDEADDPAGGGSADSVVILKAMLAAGISRGGISTICDPDAVQACSAAGIGATVSLAIGAKADTLHGTPADVTGTVRTLFRGPIAVDQWSGKTFDAGTIAVLDVAGVLVVLTERKMVTENIDIFEHLGFDVRTMQAIGFKGLGLHIRQALEGKVARFVPIDGVGVTHPDVRRLGPYREIARPIFPLDEGVTYP